jgi:carboxypeptidase C (cathepsin A)
MRPILVALAAALLLTPAAALSQSGDSGPDSGMAAQNRAEASSSHAETARHDQPTPAERSTTSGGGEGAKSDADCDGGKGGGGGSQAGESGGSAAGDARADRARCRKLTDADIATAPIGEVRVATHHTATIGGRAVAYTATAGTLTLRDDEGKPTASMFYVAYVTGEAHRPVTFLYNGGPGSSTLWLHMGSLGPVRVLTDSPQSTHNAPYTVANNADSLLDKSDLVFLDAVGAGYSRPLGDTKLSAFWGTDQDIDAFARSIERWLTVNNRWNAPKFLFGESYGTTRSAGLSYRLQSDGVQLNGVILLSSILNYGRRQPGFDQEMVNYIPSYAAAAAYHHKTQTPADLRAYLAEVRDFARGPYALALAKGQELGEDERRAVADKLASYIGLPADYILASDLRIAPGRFRKELLRGERKTLGRYDDRFTGEDFDAAGETPEFDASDTGMTGPYVAGFHDYLTRDLGYQSDLAYRPTFYASGVRWDFSHKAADLGGGGSTNQADVALDLSQAMRENPHLLLYSLNGLYDLATPFFGTEYDLGHMQLDPALRGNVRFAYYPSGHMVYLNPDALRSMKADLAKFYDEAAPGR